MSDKQRSTPPRQSSFGVTSRPRREPSTPPATLPPAGNSYFSHPRAPPIPSYPSYPQASSSEPPTPAVTTTTKSTSSSGWDAIRRRVLAPQRAWNSPTSSVSGDYAGDRANGTSGRDSSASGIGSGTRRDGLDRLAVGKGNKRKLVPPTSMLQRFSEELERAEILYEGSGRTTLTGMTTAGTETTASSSKRNGNSASKQPQADLVLHPSDPVRSLRYLEGILETYRNARTLPDQARVLSLLERPLRTRDLSQDQGWARLSLDVFVEMCGIYLPADDEEEMERWKWLLKAMANLNSPELRVRVCHIIESTILPRNQMQIQSVSPATYHSFLTSLVTLLYILISTSGRREEQSHPISTIENIIDQIFAGNFFVIDEQQITSFGSIPGAQMVGHTRYEMIRNVAFESVLLLVNSSDAPFREWLVQSRIMRKYWPNNILEGVSSRYLELWGNACHLILFSEEGKEEIDDSLALHTRTIVSQVDILNSIIARITFEHYPLKQASSSTRSSLAHLLLAFFASLPPKLQKGSEIRERSAVLEAKEALTLLWKQEKACVVEALKRAIREIHFDCLAGILGTCWLEMGEEKMRSSLVSGCLPALFERIKREPLEITKSSSMIFLLQLISTKYRTTFFKPFFALASSSSASSNIQSLSTILTLSTILKPTQYLLRDPEMMVVVLLADLGDGSGKSGWERPKLGQLALLVEMILVLRRLRSDDNLPKTVRDELAVFANAFESKFSVFLSAREQASLLPFSQRILIANLLFELRMLGKASHRPLWYPRLISWISSCAEGSFGHLEGKGGNTSGPENSAFEVSKVVSEEVGRSFGELEDLYASLKGLVCLRQTALISSMLLSPLSHYLSLFVATAACLTREDLKIICSIFWSSLLEKEPKIVHPASFLITLCGEKIGDTLNELVNKDISSASSAVRLSLVPRLTSLFSLRFDILSQPSASTSKRHPIQVGKQQLSFIPVEIGTSSYSAGDLPRELQFQLGGLLPLEVRRTLLDMGWNDKSSDQVLTDRQRRPLTLLPWSELAVETASDRPASPNCSPGRRRSSGGNDLFGNKRISAITPAVATLVMRLTELMRDQDVGVAESAQQAVLFFLRDDPDAVLRPLLFKLSQSYEDQSSAIHSIRGLLSFQSRLPPGSTNHLLNHLGGLLKGTAREASSENPLQLSSLVLPAAAALTPLVSAFSLRDLRKNKIELFFLNTGSFWFESSAPAISMFPHQVPPVDHTPYRHLTVDSSTFQVAMIRIAQNSLHTSYLRKNPSQAYTLKKLLGPLALPSTSHFPLHIDLHSFLPQDATTIDGFITRKAQDLLNVSVLVSRSWLLSVIELLRGLNRTTNDLSELATLFEGISKILLVHGRDTNIVGLALRSCMLASTRFHRLFSSGYGFSLFLPALFHVFCTALHDPPIRGAIQYAWQRFYRSHEESFVFQALGALSPLFSLDVGDDKIRHRMGADLFLLLDALEIRSINVADLPGVRGANESEEREAMSFRANERPDIFLAKFQTRSASARAALSETKPFLIESTIKLFFTVIAFDPTSVRSTTFLRLLYFLVPKMHHHSISCSDLLRDGIDALAKLFSKPFERMNKGGLPLEGTGSDAESATTWYCMRQSFISLVTAYLLAGADIGASARRVLEVVHLLLKSSTASALSLCSAFIESYTLSALGPRTAFTDERVLTFLKEMLPFVRLYINKINFDVLFDSFAQRPQTKETAICDLVSGSLISIIVNAFSANSGSDSTLFPSQHSASRLVASHLVYSSGKTVTSEFDQHPSPAFLFTFIYPLTIDFGTRKALEHETLENKVLIQGAWRDIVGYTVRAIKEAELPSTRSTRTRLAMIAISCQILKVAFVLGEEHLARESGAFTVLASVLKQTLRQGGSGFLFDTHGRPLSNLTEMSRSLVITTDDYILWSFLEFLIMYPTPLLLHFRGFLREKLTHARTQSRAFPRPTSVFSHSLLQRANSHGTGLNVPDIFQPASRTMSSRSFIPHAYLAPSSNTLSPSDSSNFEYLSSTSTSRSEATVQSAMLRQKTLERIHIVQILQGEVPIAVSVEGIEKRTRRWTIDEAIRKLGEDLEALKIEFRDVLSDREQT